jgi:hypothetical protein
MALFGFFKRLGRLSKSRMIAEQAIPIALSRGEQIIHPRLSELAAECEGNPEYTTKLLEIFMSEEGTTLSMAALRSAQSEVEGLWGWQGQLDWGVISGDTESFSGESTVVAAASLVIVANAVSTWLENPRHERDKRAPDWFPARMETQRAFVQMRSESYQTLSGWKLDLDRGWRAYSNKQDSILGRL